MEAYYEWLMNKINQNISVKPLKQILTVEQSDMRSECIETSVNTGSN